MTRNVKLVVHAIWIAGLAFSVLALASNSGTGSSYQSLAQIVFACDIELIDEICVVNSDGTGFSQLTDIQSIFADMPDVDNPRASEPLINADGQIVFRCMADSYLELNGNLTRVPGGAQYLCLMNSDGSSFQMIDNVSAILRYNITDSGNVYYTCNDQPFVLNLCRFTIVNGEIKMFENEVPQTPYSNSSIFETNIAYECTFFEPDERLEICIFDAATGETIRLTNNITSDRDPILNEDGLVAYECLSELGRGFLCFASTDGATPVRVPDMRPWLHYSLNNAGQAAAECILDNLQGICFIDQGGQHVERIVDRTVHEELSALSDQGLVAFICNGQNLCSINSDGTGLQQLVDGIALSTTPGIKGIDIQ